MTVTVPDNYTEIQSKGSVYSRNHKNGSRVRRNVYEFVCYLNPPLLCIGCGDGLELEYFRDYYGLENGTKQILGVDISEDKIQVCLDHGLNADVGTGENIFDIVGDKKYDIYTAHTLEHSFDLKKTLNNYKKIALSTIIIIVPIEVVGTHNKAHLNPISNLSQITRHFGINWRITTFYRFNLQAEGVVIAKRSKFIKGN